MNPQAPITPVPGNSKIPLIASTVLGVLLIAAIVFGWWAFSGRQDYKNNSDKKSAAAVSAAQKALSAQLQAQYDAKSQSPYKTFSGPATYGSVSFNYPKNWSAYVDQTSPDQPIEAYFYPDQVPGISGNTAFALRVELVANDYSSLLDQFQSNIQDGSITASAYLPPKMKGVANAQAGTRLDGQINQGSDGTPQNGSMVILKVRDKSLQIYTESNNYVADFNDIILASLKFTP